MTLPSTAFCPPICQPASVDWDGELDRYQIGAGDRIAICRPLSYDLIHLYFACWNRGAVVCPVNLRLPKAAQQDAVDRMDPKLVIGVDIAVRKMQYPSFEAATMLMTSGSTGRPKIAVHSLENHLASARGYEWLVDHRGRWHLTLPLYHVGGIGVLFRCALVGGSVQLEVDGATHTSLVPTQLKRMRDRGSLEVALLGGAALPDKVRAHGERLGLNVHEAYGLTEMSSSVTVDGRPLSGQKIKLVDGEIYVSGSALFQGYWEEGKVQNVGEWFATSDLGDEVDGRIQVRGRKSQMIISGGENILPEEIEAALLGLQGVEQVAVVGVPSEEWGERPVAFIGGRLEGLEDELRQVLPGYKIPDQLLPLPPEACKGLKIDRAALREEFLTRRERREERIAKKS